MNNIFSNFSNYNQQIKENQLKDQNNSTLNNIYVIDTQNNKNNSSNSNDEESIDNLNNQFNSLTLPYKSDKNFIVQNISK